MTGGAFPERQRWGPKGVRARLVGAVGVITLLMMASGCGLREAYPTRSQRVADADPAAHPMRWTEASEVSPAGLEDPQMLVGFEVIARPPLGWGAEPMTGDARHRHQVWVSPTGRTVYGVVRFDLPLPVGPELVLRGFLSEMRKREGEARLAWRWNDSALPGIRFVAEGATYRLRVNLLTRGWKGWAVYAGTYEGEPEDTSELDLAERARDSTIFDKE